jgi:hypothetical protein
MPFYENFGFKNHPFAQTNADEEPLLKDYFVPPPFFDAVVGDAKLPGPCMVLAPRGAGKTAQRRMVEAWAAKNGVLAVTYDRFEFASGQSLEDIGLAYHLKNIIVRILLSYLSFLAEFPDLLRNLDSDKRRTLSLFIHTYLGDMTGERLQDVLKDLKTISEKIREFWSRHVGVLESVVNVLLKQYGLDTIDLPDLRHEEKKVSHTYKYQLEILADVVRLVGCTSIYILVDKLDESEKTGTNPEKTYRLLEPLVKDLELMGLHGYGFKFFVWDRILPFFRKDARPDRMAQHTLSWTRPNLEKVLSARLSAFSGGSVKSFGQLLSENVSYSIDAAMCLIANGSPRNLVRMCEKILAVQAERDPQAKSITMASVDRGIVLYCEEITEELYGEEVCRDLMRTGRELFTINYLANDVFKTTHENTSRNKVTKWQEAGVVTQIGTVSVASAKRPLNFYYVCDPAMTRIIHQAQSLEVFLKNRWLTCTHCGVDNLMDIELLPEGNDALCHECNRNLFG